MGIGNKKYAFAALFAALFTILLFNCEPDSTTTAGITEKTGAPSEFTTLTVSGFTGDGIVEPNGDYSLITDLTNLEFSSEYAEGGEVSIDLTKPVYKRDITYSDNTSETWYLWASVSPSRYILSRSNMNGLWYFEDAPVPPASPAASPQDIAQGSWKKSSSTATQIAENSGNASADPQGKVLVTAVDTISVSGGPSVEAGSTVQLTADVGPANASNKSVTWSSSNESVATVDANGLVTGVAAGTVTITATAKDGSGISGQATVTVTAASGGGSTAPKPVTGIVISVKAGSSDSIAVGNNSELEAAVTPADADNPAVTWQSDNTAVATVDASTGVVTGVAAGTAKITAASTDNTTITSNELTITVVAAAKPVTSVSIALKTGSSNSIVVGTTTEFEATVDPTDATDKSVDWRSSDATVATVDATGVVTALAVGSTNITAVSKDGSAVTSNAVPITVTPKPVSSISIALKSGSSDNIFTGDTTEFEATVLPTDAADKSVDWQSSDTSVATVDASGVVTSLKAGATDITAVSKDGSNVSSSAITVTVTAPVTINGQPAAAYNTTTKKLAFSVKFTEAVTVTTTSGTPNYTFAVTKITGAAAVTKTAAYVRGSGTDTLVFEYTKEDGVFGTVSYAADPINLNGGSLAGATVSRVSLSGITANTNAATIAAIISAVGVSSTTTIPDASLTASSEYDVYTTPSKGRLNGYLGWAPRTATVGQWWQVDMGSARDVVRIATQGRSNGPQWITSYKLQYSLDGSTWTDYNNGQTLSGNTNQSTVVVQDLATFRARYVRLYPQTWNSGGYPTGRFEVHEGK